MLATNRCHSAFWLGNLKNRDIHGNEIQSQMSIVDEDGEEDSEQVNEAIKFAIFYTNFMVKTDYSIDAILIDHVEIRFK